MTKFKTSMIAGMFAVTAAFSGAASANVLGVSSVTISQSSGFGFTEQYLQLAEVVALQAGTGIDVALASRGATATASSFYAGIDMTAMAIDGIVADGNLFHSARGANESLTIKFSSAYDLSTFMVYGRTDCCANRNVYDIRLFGSSGNLLFTQIGVSANNALNLAAVDLPEPSSLALIAAALLSAGALRRRKA